MIDLYTWGTPNGRKVSIMLEETGLDYTTHPIHIGKDEQFAPDFLKVSPNNKIPAIVDNETGLSLMESGAILLYLGRKTGKFLPAGEGEDYWRVMEWLMWQMGGIGPFLGQAHHFLHFNPGKAPYAEERYGKEARRLYGVLDKRLEAAGDYVAGDYSVADMAIWPWIARFEWQEIDLGDFPRVKDWYVRIAERAAVQRGYKVPDESAEIPMP
ncbi:glutathione S-transferase N-terminal domain-containing protein [Kaustia mangrovi]|uniref:Glutathione S-transferase N-terminal domain-containing protein n=1 Tax=Kaustia mangrovi TaxID=2593653 RepID=A0A7S8C1Y2_9HYPH|nr:glutathione S-transferase N-terminal domain-containing protein [Kaustia mangrovi]QPC41890.1 glutathione S-transferase N-terminal domain-containing protein [Kaustia mangrovi]